MSQSVESISPPLPPPASAVSALCTPATPSTPAAASSCAAPRFPWLATWIVLVCLGAVLSAALVLGAHGTRGFYLPALAALVCLLAGLFDGHTGRIPNQLTYTAILIGLLLNGIAPLLAALHAPAAVVWLGAAGPESSLEGFGICAALGLLGCLAAGVHGGDVKLLAGVGAMLGLLQTANVMLVALSAALAYALANLALFGGLNRVVRVGAMRGLELIYLRRFATPVEEEGPQASHIPMAVPLGLGLIVAQFWQWKTGGLFL